MPGKTKQASENQISLFDTPSFGVNDSNSKSDIDKKEGTEEQGEFIDLKSKISVILKATAGSGKTFTCVKRMQKLLERGVDPSKIIFFSFTKAAVEELKERVGNDEIEIKTIHSFCGSVLAKLNKSKRIVTFYDFIKWFSENRKPNASASPIERNEFDSLVDDMYSDADYYSSKISAFKLQSSSGESLRVPRFWNAYKQFLFAQKGMDFSDMLIEVRDLFRDDRYLRRFKNQYDYIFVDEYQDTSLIQMQILLALNANTYYLVGDEFQMLYSYSGANCKKIEELLEKRRKVKRMNLSINFRSDQYIVDNSNNFSDLKAIANSKNNGNINKKIILTVDDLVDVFSQKEQVVGLVRTNAVLKKLELEFLKRKIPINYFNYITPEDIKDFKKGKVRRSLEYKLNRVKQYFDNNINSVIAFIAVNKTSNKFFTTIHKSKGREFHTCVVVNSISEDVLSENGILERLNRKQYETLTFCSDDEEDFDSKCVHYVAVSRSKHNLYYMIYDI